jgi:hypothetical protein
MRFIAAAGFALMLSCVLGACGGDAVPDVVATPEVRDASGASLAPQVRLSGERDADLHLWVSNQSFIDDPVVLAVSIDGVELIKQPFDVEGQHNWILLPVQAPPGRHTMRALSSTGAEIQTTFTLPQHGRRYAVIDYWNYPDDGGRHITWRFQKAPLAFA